MASNISANAEKIKKNVMYLYNLNNNIRKNIEYDNYI